MNTPISRADKQYFTTQQGILFDNGSKTPFDLVRATNMPNNLPDGNPDGNGVYVIDDNSPGFDTYVRRTNQNVWKSGASIQAIVQAIIDLEPNFRTTIDMTGFPLGYLVHSVRNELLRRSSRVSAVDNFMKGLVLTGICYNFKTTADTDVQIMGETDVITEVERVDIKEFPLDKIDFFNPDRQRYNYDEGPTSVRRLENIFNGTLEFYLSSLKAQTGGSNVSCYITWENCTIARRSRPPVPDVMFRRHKTVRTGGFQNLLLNDYQFKVSVDDHEFTIFIPSGKENCFDSCVKWGYVQYYDNVAFSCLNLEAELEMQDAFAADGRTRKNILLDEIGNIIDRAKTMKKGNREYVHKYQKKQSQKVEEDLGYTSHRMSKMITIYEENNIDVFLWRLKDGQWISKPDRKTSGKECQIGILTMTDSGHIRGFKNTEDETKEASGLLHAVGIYPCPSKEFLCCSYNRSEFVRKFHMNSVGYMKSIFEDASYDKSLDQESLRTAVEYQMERHKAKKTKTLIFHTEKDQEETEENMNSNAQQRKRKRWEREYNDKIDHYVFAYDLETVTNRADNQHKVYEPFQRISESANMAPIEAQIPFSAQWVPVNVSDIGRFLDRKVNEGVLPRLDEIPTEKIFIEEGCIYDNEYEVMLDDVVTEYGNDLLGKCIEDMLVNIAHWVNRRGAKYAYLYAHNGVGFDAFIVLQFNRFPVKNILKTSRGILSMSITIDLGNDESVVIILRDTKVHMPGTLSGICKSFDVPKKWRKLDFPITKVNAFNYDHPEVKEICRSYGENDVRCLAFIVKRINEMIMESEWNPAQVYNKPPIAQFLTCMSIVKAATRNHFIQKTVGGLSNIHAHAVDIPVLRHWLVEATMGGRANAYARTYMHPMLSSILEYYVHGEQELLKKAHQEIMTQKNSMQVLDVTSLYPHAQANCPMPTGELYFISPGEAVSTIDAIHCPICERQYSLCEKHQGENCEQRPFAIILIKNMRPINYNNRCMTGRKLHGTNQLEGLEYSLESIEEVNERYGKEKLKEVQAYSNVDLYWMKKQGYAWGEILGGFAWKTSMTYHSFITPAFLKRIEAKKAGNKVLSNSLKLMYNSTYGVTAQKDITENGFVASTPEELQGLHHDDNDVLVFVNSNHNKVNCDEELCDSLLLRSGQTYFTKKKKKHLSEFFCEQSPIQIGCAVLSWARHVMNLIMFAFPLTHQTYTDTDSICIRDEIVQDHLKKTPGLVNNASDAALGSLKNDHLEGPNGESNGKEPRVIMSLIGTKKVKMHVTLNEEGELKVFNTFKGLKPASVHPVTKKRMNSDYGEKLVAQSLLEINQCGKMSEVVVDNWQRSLSNGIIISEHLQTSSLKTYLGHSKGSKIYTQHARVGLLETFIPHGGKFFSDLYDEGNNFEYICNPKDKNVSVYPPNSIRYGIIDSYCSYHLMQKMLDKYYVNANKEYTIDTPEYKHILSVFEKV